MIKTGMWPVIVLGVIAGLVRVFGPTSVADFIAMGYLSAATVAFGRPLPLSSHLLHPAPFSPTSMGRRIFPK